MSLTYQLNILSDITVTNIFQSFTVFGRTSLLALAYVDHSAAMIAVQAAHSLGCTLVPCLALHHQLVSK